MGVRTSASMIIWVRRRVLVVLHPKLLGRAVRIDGTNWNHAPCLHGRRFRGGVEIVVVCSFCAGLGSKRRHNGSSPLLMVVHSRPQELPMGQWIDPTSRLPSIAVHGNVSFLFHSSATFPSAPRTELFFFLIEKKLKGSIFCFHVCFCVELAVHLQAIDIDCIPCVLVATRGHRRTSTHQRIVDGEQALRTVRTKKLARLIPRARTNRG